MRQYVQYNSDSTIMIDLWRLEDTDEDVGVRNEAAISATPPLPRLLPPSSHTNAATASALTDRYSLWEYVCMFVWCCVLCVISCDVCIDFSGAAWALPPP